MNKGHLTQSFVWFRTKSYRLKMLKALNLFCTGFTYIAFFLVLIWLGIERNPLMIRLVLTCGISFVGLSIFRRILNCPRPYEVYGMPPLLHKETRGNSFPSRHIFSICVIGTSMLYILRPLGMFLLTLGAILATVRVVSGVHFIRDVAAGAAIGIFSAIAGFSLIAV